MRVLCGLTAAAAIVSGGLNPVRSGDDRCDQYGAAPCETPCVPSRMIVRPPQAPQYVAPAPGMYAQPPAVGEQRGETRSTGVRGLRLRFPAFSFELPSLELPGRYGIRRGAEMRVDENVAPYVEGQAATYGMMSAGGQALTADQMALYRLQLHRGMDEAAEPAPASRPLPCDGASGAPQPSGSPEGAPAPPAESLRDDTYWQLGELQRQLQQLQAAVERMSACPQGGTTEVDRTVASTRAAVLVRQPSVETYNNADLAQFEANYEQKCQESEALRAQLAELQQSYQQLLDAKQRQIVAQREERLRQQIGVPGVTEPAATQAPAPRPMPAVARRVEPANYQETAPMPTLYRPSSSGEVFGEATDSTSQYQWREPEPQARRSATQAQTETRSASSQPGAQNQSRTVRPKEEGKLSKGVLSRWFGGRK